MGVRAISYFYSVAKHMLQDYIWYLFDKHKSVILIRNCFKLARQMSIVFALFVYYSIHIMT